VARLRALGDGTPLVAPTGGKGLVAVRTALDPRAVVRALREVAVMSPGRFRATWKWVPVDLWTGPDLGAMRAGVERLRGRIGASERWRMTVEKRGSDGPPTPALIDALAALIPAPVDLAHPDRILMVQVFPDRAALSVLAPSEVFSVVSVASPAMPATLDLLSASLPSLPIALARRVAGAVGGGARPFRETVDLALELLGGAVPDWPVLSAWNDWCLRHGASFFVWAPSRGGLSDRVRAEALIHTIMMLSAKEQAIRDYLASGVHEAEVAMAGDDCVVCDGHRHRKVPLDGTAAAALPPFHPGCRCGFRPHLG
jgi:tRNA acetyltransferase TAN1